MPVRFPLASAGGGKNARFRFAPLPKRVFRTTEGHPAEVRNPRDVRIGFRSKEDGGSVRESNPPETLLPPDRI